MDMSWLLICPKDPTHTCMCFIKFTQEHLATSIDKAALAGAAANERLAVLSLLLQQYTWRAVERTGEEGP